MIDSDAIETVLRAVRREPTVVTSTEGLKPYAMVPEGFKIEAIDQLRTRLDRVEQRVSLLTAESFVDYWKRFAKGDSVIFADERTGTYSAVLDYHKAAGEPAWCRHVAVFLAQDSREWQTWMGLNGKPVPQAEFALFIEDNYVDIVKPEPADMIAVAMNLSAKKSVEFASSMRLDNGQTQLVYQEKITGSAERAQGQMKIPDVFVIRIPVLLGGTPTKIDARLRYRISDGKLSMWYDLHRPAHIRDAAIRESTEAIRKALGSAPFFLGARG